MVESGRKTLRPLGLARVVSMRSTLPALSYILTELPSAQCFTRTPSARFLKLVVSSPRKRVPVFRPRNRMTSGFGNAASRAA